MRQADELKRLLHVHVEDIVQGVVASVPEHPIDVACGSPSASAASYVETDREGPPSRAKGFYA